MQPLNIVQLRGRVGFLRLRQINDSTVANFSVCVEETFTRRDGEATKSVQYINVAAWDDPRRPVSTLQQGCEVEVHGRIVSRKFVDRDCVERSITEVKADTVKVLSYPAPKEPEQADMPDDMAF